MQKILVIGATSAIAKAAARQFAAQGDALCLLARNQEKLDALASDLRVRGAGAVHAFLFEANDFASHGAVLDQAIQSLGGLDTVLIAHGTLGDQKACERDFNEALRELNTNAISVISLLTHLANYFEAQRRGCIAVISSVAGDRGRQSNYVYGAAKGMVSTFLQGLRNRLFKSGVHVLTIKPGFVDTPMTAAFSKGALWATPEAVAAGIVRAIAKRRDVVYLPFWWRWIMLAVRTAPEVVCKRLSW